MIINLTEHILTFADDDKYDGVKTYRNTRYAWLIMTYIWRGEDTWLNAFMHSLSLMSSLTIRPWPYSFVVPDKNYARIRLTHTFNRNFSNTSTHLMAANYIKLRTLISNRISVTNE